MLTQSLRIKYKQLILRISLCLLGLILARTTWVKLLSSAQAGSPSGMMVKSYQKISDTEGGFTGTLIDGDEFGAAVTALDDLDRDGVTELVVGAHLDKDGGDDRGAVWVLFMHSDGTVKGHQKISSTVGNFTGGLNNGDQFGITTANLGDLDGDGIPDLAVGAFQDDEGGTNRGAIWILFLNSNGTVKDHQKISDTMGNFTGILDDFDQFGATIANLGDRDGDGVIDLAVGAFADDDGAAGQSNHGAVWILFLNSNGTVKDHQKISDTAGNFGGVLANDDLFGSGVATLNDLNGDSVGDLAVGAFASDDGGDDRGAAWVLFMNQNNTVKGQQKIGMAQGGFTGILDDNDRFGGSIVNTGDLDGDGIQDLAVGAYRDDDGGIDRGAIWILFMNTDGTVKDQQKISAIEGDFGGILDDSDFFARSMNSLGDLNNDGAIEIVVGSPLDDDGGTDRGAIWILSLDKPKVSEIYLPLVIKDCIFTILGCL